VREIFERGGEAEFRRLERQVLTRTFEREPLVVAVGGGTLVDPGALAATSAHGRVIWLDAPFELLVRRIGPRGKLDRPLFRDEEQARALLRERTGAYRRSDLTVEVGPEATPAEIAGRILIELRLREAACTT
jgi:shikimate kinase